MGKTEILLIAVGVLAALSVYNMYDNMEPHRETMFNVWMNMHCKNYAAAEKEYRKGIWMSNFEFVQTHNARYEAGQESYNLEMNAYADLTNE